MAWSAFNYRTVHGFGNAATLLSQGSEIDKLLRALIGVVMFSAAYMAEVIRGGLQAILKGQYEAADALGLSYWKKWAYHPPASAENHHSIDCKYLYWSV